MCLSVIANLRIEWLSKNKIQIICFTIHTCEVCYSGKQVLIPNESHLLYLNFLGKIIKKYKDKRRKIKKTKKTHFFLNACFVLVFYVFFCVVLCFGICTGHLVMVHLNLTYLHCLQHYLFKHIFNLYYIIIGYVVCSYFINDYNTGKVVWLTYFCFRSLWLVILNYVF